MLVPKIPPTKLVDRSYSAYKKTVACSSQNPTNEVGGWSLDIRVRKSFISLTDVLVLWYPLDRDRSPLGLSKGGCRLWKKMKSRLLYCMLLRSRSRPSSKPSAVCVQDLASLRLPAKVRRRSIWYMMYSGVLANRSTSRKLSSAYTS